MSLRASYYDGRSAQRHEVELSVVDGQLYLSGEGVARSEPLAQVRIGERLGAGPRLLSFGDNAYCEVRDHAGLEARLRAGGYRPHRAIETLQGSWRVALIALAAVLVSAVAAYRWGLPIAAEVIAARVPAGVSQQISRSALATLDRAWLQPSKLPAERREALSRGYARLDSGETAEGPRLEFRSSPAIGPNAFALPDGTVVVLDELVELAANDEEIYAVLAHEQGHVHYRHGLRMILQGSAVAAAMTAWVGDFSTLLALLPTALLETRYSREFEAQADDYAVAQLQAQRVSPARLADLLERIVALHDARTGGKRGGSEESFLSSHPAPAERIRRLRAAGPSATPTP
ncbi:MAG: M48 family metallopeptidase [Nevskia sp.]